LKPTPPIRVSEDFLKIIHREKQRLEKNGIDLSIPMVTKMMAKKWNDMNGKKTLIDMMEIDLRKRKIRL